MKLIPFITTLTTIATRAINTAGGGVITGFRKLLEDGTGFKLNEDGSYKLLE